MKRTASILLPLSLAATAQAQVGPRVTPAAYEPYARQLGEQQFPGGQARREDRITAMESLPSGAAVVAGFTYGALGEAHAGLADRSDIFVARFDVDGTLQWVSQIGAVTAPSIPGLNGDPTGPGGDASHYDFAQDVALAADGSIFVTGGSSGSLGETNAGSSDVVLAKFAPSGALLWLRQIGAETAATIPPAPGALASGSATWGEYASSIALHADGGVYVGGSTGSNLSEEVSADLWDFFLARYDASGDLEWVRQMSTASAPLIGYDPEHSDDAGAIALHPDGRVVLAGSTTAYSSSVFAPLPLVMTFDGAGQPLDWTGLGTFGRLNDVAIHEPTGRILVAGDYHLATLKFTTQNAAAASLHADLSLDWYRIMDSTSTAHLGLLDPEAAEQFDALRVDAAGDLYVVGSTRGSLNEPHAGTDVFTARLRGSDGHIDWVSQIGQTTGTALGIDVSGDDFAADGAMGPGHTIFLAGRTDGSLGEPQAGDGDALLIRVDRVGRLR